MKQIQSLPVNKVAKMSITKHGDKNEKSMSLFVPEDIDKEMLLDLKEEIIELSESSENILIELELTPEDNELQRALFRNIHTIKGDLGLVGFTPMIHVLQHLEDILDLMRKGSLLYSSYLNDLVTCLLQRVSTFINECIEHGKTDYERDVLDNTVTEIKKINASNPSLHQAAIEQALLLLRGENASLSSDNEASQLESAKTGVPKNLTESQMNDLLFFRELMRPVEKRFGYTDGRGDKVASLALYINSLSEHPISEAQLAVACYVHDFGLAFMPHDIAQNNAWSDPQKDAEISTREHKLMRSHVYKSTRLLESLNEWDEARKIIMQHHENVDGSGYPLGLKGGDICEGAKLLSIVDKFIQLTYCPNNEATEFSEVEAVIEINQNFRKQVSSRWLRLFNQAMTKKITTLNVT